MVSNLIVMAVLMTAIFLSSHKNNKVNPFFTIMFWHQFVAIMFYIACDKIIVDCDELSYLAFTGAMVIDMIALWVFLVFSVRSDGNERKVYFAHQLFLLVSLVLSVARSISEVSSFQIVNDLYSIRQQLAGFWDGAVIATLLVINLRGAKDGE